LINRVKELKSLYNLSVRVFAAGDVKGAFREVFAEIKRVMKVSEAAYFELNNGLFNYVFSSFDSKFSMENKPALKKEFLSKNNGVKAAKDINAPDEIMSVFNKLSFRKIFVVPAKVGEKTKGLMIGGIKKKSKSFSQNELNTLTLYSSRLAEYIERNRMISVITEDNVRLKELNEVKNNFIALISHELRTPLTTIKGFSEVMYEGQTGDLTEEQKSCFKNILDSARLLGEKIDSIIDFVSLRKGDLEIKREKIQWNNLIEDVCSEFSDELERKNIKFTIKKDRKIGDVYVDAEKIKKAVRQLVSNAVKFNKIGGSINIKTKHRGDFFETVIKDNGIGIDEDMNSRIFEEFFQLEDPVTRSVNGIGIGLTLARSIFEVHGGTIEVKSKEKTGTRVNVLLPVKNRKYLRDKNPDGEKKNDK